MRRPGRRARRVIAGAVTVAVVGVGYAAYAASAHDTSYRTATAELGDVEQTLDVSGAVEPAGRADLSFATSGDIDDITVEPGDKVKAGEVLGTLDDTGLRTSLQRARATLASARAQLESDEDAQADTVSSSTPATSSSGSSGSSGSSEDTPSKSPSKTPSKSPTNGSDDALAELAGQQQAVTVAQSTVSASLTAARDALTAQQAACAAAFTTDPTAGDTTDQACTDALAAVQTAQQQVATDQDALQSALTDLARTLSAAAAGLQTEDDAEPSSTPSTSTPATSTPSVSIPSASTPSTGTTGGMTVSAATLAKDQAAIDQARADLVVAQQELRMATVTAPFAGEVVAVDAAEGDSVSSGTEVFVLVSRGTSTVLVGATSAQVQQLEVGQQATATPAGSDQELAGTVTQISTVPDDASAYPVTITLKRKHLDIATGLNASVSVVTGTAQDVVTVPASAVTDGAVTVQDGDAVTRTRVTTGVVGATTVEVTDGLAAGDVVVLADLDRALPTTDDSSTQRRAFGGGFGGTGGPPTGGGGPPSFSR